MGPSIYTYPRVDMIVAHLRVNCDYNINHHSQYAMKYTYGFDVRCFVVVILPVYCVGPNSMRLHIFFMITL